MKNCSICKAEIENENPSVLTMGGYGNPRYVCENCDAEIERMLYSQVPAEAQAAMKQLGDHLARIGCEDNAVIDTMQEMMRRAGERAAAIEKGAYDFSEDAAEEGEEENEVDDDLIVDYIKDLERKAMSLTGKQIKIQNKGKCRLVQIEYVDNEDLEDILVKLCGRKITEE